MARITHLDVGDRATPQATFTVGGTPTDPTQIIVRQQDADGVETVVTTAASPSTLTPSSTPLARVSVGVFKLNPGVSMTKQGYWFYRFEATGTAESAEDFQYVVDPSEFFNAAGLASNALVSLPEMKDWLQVQQITTENDFELVSVINEVSDLFQFEAEREIKPANPASHARLFEVEYVGRSEPRYIDGEYMGELNAYNRTVKVGDLSATPSLVRILDEDWTTSLETVTAGNRSDFPLVRQSWEPIRELRFQTSVTALSPGMRVEVTGVWGFPSVPGFVKRAVKDAVASVMDRDVEHYRTDLGVQAPSEGGGNVIVVGGGRQRLLSLPPTTLAVAWKLRDNWIG